MLTILANPAEAIELELLSDINFVSVYKTDITVHSSLSAKINIEALMTSGNTLRVTLPNFTEIFIQKTKFQKHKNNRKSWFGKILGVKQGYVNFAIVGERVHGSIVTEDSSFEILSKGDGLIRINEIDTQEFSDCESEIDSSMLPLIPIDDSLKDNSLNKVDPTTLDVLIVYSNNTLAELGTHNDVVALAQASIDTMNTILTNSLLTAGISEVRLLDVVGVDRDETGVLANEVNWLASDFNVRTLRNQLGADMVSMLTSLGGCGLGVTMRNPSPFFSESAFQVTKHTCAVGNLSMAHEFGHNLGMEHDPAHGGAPDNASFPYSFGYFHDGNYRTVMSYSSACNTFCPRKMYYSNPDQNFNGLPTGLADFNDNVRTLEQTSLIVANFRTHIENVIFISGFESSN